MGANSKIEWTNHTFNPWRGCAKVSSGCANCYAERQAKRNPKQLGVWGPDGVRVVAGDKYWGEPLKWNRKAELDGVRARVFCGSMCDVFEARHELDDPLCRLLLLIHGTPSLDWLLLTKRPENFDARMAAASASCDQAGALADQWRYGAVMPNIWMGTSVENQQAADERIPFLLKTPAAVRFLSCEPLLLPVELSLHFLCRHCAGHRALQPKCGPAIDWVIAGGESGPKARPPHPDWFRSLRDQCQATGVPFFFKQWGEWQDGSAKDAPNEIVLVDGRHRPTPQSMGWAEKWHRQKPTMMARVGKKAAGRMLDGREWNELPAADQWRALQRRWARPTIIHHRRG